MQPPGFQRRLNHSVWDGAKRSYQGTWVVFCGVALLIAFMADSEVARLLTLQSSNVWHRLAIYASKAGEGWVVAVAGLSSSSVLFLLKRFKASRGAFLIAGTGLLTGATATIIRSLLGRTRPDSHEVQGFYGVWHDAHWIIGRYEFGAFPSGHVATVIGLAAAAWLINRRLGALAFVYALIVSWSRIALGCHHFSDEIAATILGIYGAHMVFLNIGRIVQSAGERLQNAWVRQPLSSKPKEQVAETVAISTRSPRD
jgi:membrane-associated phospholipid phosphatase